MQSRSPSGRVLLLNTPHNPTGKVFDRAELETIAELALRHDLIVVADEVYEHLAYERAHVPIATLPGMGDGAAAALAGWRVDAAGGSGE